MDIQHVDNGDYGRYEELLLQRDALEKEAFLYGREYTRVFGGRIVAAFELKVDCIALKKAIAFYITAKNRGAVPDADELAAKLGAEMAAYRARLEALQAEKEAAGKGRPIGAYELGEIKKIYRRIARQLHPDLSPLILTYPELNDLFQRAMIAYQCNDLKELRALEVLIGTALREKGVESFYAEIPDIEARIAELEEEIGQILSGEPYRYKELLSDAERIRKKEEELDADVEEYTRYKAELTAQLNELKEEAKTQWRILN